MAYIPQNILKKVIGKSYHFMSPFLLKILGDKSEREAASEFLFNSFGNIGACTCRDPQGSGAFHLGNIMQDHLDDIWHGSRRRALFTCFRSGRYPNLCRRCSRYASWDSSVLKIMRNTQKST